MPPLCHDRESNDISRWYPLNSNQHFQWPLWTSAWFDFIARWYWKLHYRELVGEPLILQLNFTFPLKCVAELIVVEDRMASVAVEKFGVVEKKSRINNVSPARIICISLFKYRYFDGFLSDYVPVLPNKTFPSKNTESNGIQSEHLIRNYREKKFFADSFGSETYSMHKQHYEHKMPQPLQSHPNVCSFYTIYMQLSIFWRSAQK